MAKNVKIEKKILFTTSTMPASDEDPVPGFVKDEAIWLKKLYPHLKISILAPHNAYSDTKKYTNHKYYDEYRFHYFWPFSWERLTGKGIQPALKKNKFLYIQLPGLFIFEFFATLKYVRRLKPDLIYAHWFTPQALTGALVSRFTGVPMVFDTQASDAIVLKRVPFSKKIVSWVCEQSLAYTVPSQQTLDKLLFFATEKNRRKILNKVTMIPYGTTPFKVTEKAKKNVANIYSLSDKRFIYFIGRLVDRKGVDILLRSFQMIHEKDPSILLVIVGDGQDRSKLESLAQKLGLKDCVIFTGFVTGEDRYALLSLADVCAIPSVNVGDQSEGLPVVFMEGLTFNKVMVISDATGAHEIVNNTKDAFVAKAGSVKDLALNLTLALKASQNQDKDLYRSIAKLAERFQWPAIAKKRYEALLNIERRN